MENQTLSTDVVIVGAGPAGTTCAYLLKKAGIDCLLIDHATFPRDKICGGGLTVKAWTLLNELMPNFNYPYQRIGQLQLIVDKVSCDILPKKELRIVNRKEFDHLLLQQYLNAGGRFMQGAFAKFEDETNGNISVKLKAGQTITCRYLVGADGANSHIRKQLLGPYDGNTLWLEQYTKKSGACLTGELPIKQFKNGYYYVFPGTDRDVVGYGHLHSSVSEFKKILAERGIAETKIRGAYIPVKEVESGRDNIILIGDAGGFANKLTYEGLYYAIATARNAAEAIITGKSFKQTNAQIFKRKRREKRYTAMFYSPIGLGLLKWLTRHQNLIGRIFDKGIKPS